MFNIDAFSDASFRHVPFLCTVEQFIWTTEED